MRRRKKHSKFLTLFFDFYVINELYLRCGGFRDIGYPNYNVFVPEKIYETIKFQYEYIVELMFNHTVKCLANSIRKELINNFYCEASYEEGGHKYPMTTEKLLEDAGHTLKIFYGNGIIKNASKAHILFSNYIWTRYYGGEAWAKATEELVNLKNVKTTKDKVYWIDRVMHLHHNTGHILNKTRFRCISRYYYNNNTCYGTYLDFRATAPTIFDLSKLCSSNIYKLVIPRTRILI
jgi:hypothetical protein